MKKLTRILIVSTLTLLLGSTSATLADGLAETEELERRGESHSETMRNEHALLLEEEPIVEPSAAEEEALDEDGSGDDWEEWSEEEPIGLAQR